MAINLDLLEVAKHVVNGTFETKLCVVCLSFLDEFSEKVSFVFYNENYEYTLAFIMNELFRIEIADHDNYSVCLNCIRNLQTAYITYLTARKNNSILISIADSLYNQIGNLELSNDTYPCLVVPSKIELINQLLQINQDITPNIQKTADNVTTMKLENIYEEFDDTESNMSKVILDIKPEVVSQSENESSGEEKLKKHKKRMHKSYMQCTRCSVKYKFVAKMISHMKNDHGAELFVCKVCQHMSEDSNQHLEHMGSHKDVYTCSICDSTFKRYENLKVHFQKHASGKHSDSHICELCGATMPTEYALRMHIDKNHTRKRFTCHFCGKMYKIESSFDSHIEKHKRWMGSSHKCTTCPRSFPSAELLTAHIQSSHEHKSPYTCVICDQSFNTEDMLRTHVSKHGGGHVCEICNASFTHARSLLWHKRLHNNEKPYACNQCDRRFVSSARRNQHAMCAHSAPARRCPLCPALFHLNSMVNTHIKKVHLKFPKRRNRCSKFENVTWKTQVVPIHDLSVSLQNDIMELRELEENSANEDVI